MEEREISISPLFKWLTKRSHKKGKKVRKTRLLRGKKFKTVKEGLDEGQVVTFVDNLLDQHGASQQASADSLRSLLKTAVTDAEQFAASIKMKAQAEAEAEAAEIITQARQEDQEIKRRAEIAAQKEAEDILSAANKKAEDILSVVDRKDEITEVEARQNALLFLLRAREEIEKEVREEYKDAYARLSSSLQNLMDEGQNIEVELKSKRAQLWESKNFELKEHEAALLEASGEAVPPAEALAPEEVEEKKIEQPEKPRGRRRRKLKEQPAQLQEEEVTEEKIEQPAQFQEEEVVVSAEPAKATTEEAVEQHPLDEIPDEEETPSTQLKPRESQTLYVGEIELAIAIPVELRAVSKFYNYLQTIPDVKILRTTGSWDRGTTITVVADKPVPLISTISEIPGVEVISELSQQDSSVKGTLSSRRREGGKGVKKIKLTLKEA